ncbi:hypothetical protein BRADI_1g64442v3 [Brachypodium distachyon]|uniref:Uncharacterized protein n=1 Tax=Brachypodium distachyon TaxID=15368 RepID=A0A0Q3SAM2_BRADI|nr:hypothetical protein BRADI_1g64442v3 [Brachypodium distachyon]
MRKAKMGGGDLTRNFCKNRKACKTEWISGRLRDGDSSQDVCTKLSDCGRSVVSISLCNGDITLFSCSGMAIGHEGYRITRFLSSASLVRALHGKTNEHYFDLKIEVRREGKEVYRGFMGEYDLVHNVAVVKVCGFRDVTVGNFHRKLKSVPHGEACVVGRDVSGDLMAKSVELGEDLRAYVDDKDLDSKTSMVHSRYNKAILFCLIYFMHVGNKNEFYFIFNSCSIPFIFCSNVTSLPVTFIWEGATIFSFHGKVAGTNLFLVTERTVFLPWGTILKCLDRYWKTWEKERGLARSTSLVDGFGAPVGGKSNRHPEGRRDCLNQEHLDIDLTGMILVNAFEEPFGDIRGEGVWAKLGEKTSSRINRSVVALASFNGEKRNFACTGFFIGWNGSTKILTSASLIRNSGDENNIVENLRIEVLLPSNRSINGTLEHYDLHYNVALVSVKNCYNLRPANTLASWPMCSDVAAIGRCFKSRELTATSGQLIFSTSALDCFLLPYSSCKITKLGIGGPLVTLDGDVLGMNFYDKKIGTPFLFWADIRKILASFDKRSTTGEICNDTSGVPL